VDRVSKQKKLWIFAGEASGDMYGARLAHEVKDIMGNDVKISGMGASKMRNEGVELLIDSTELGVMGFIEVLKMIRTFKKVFKRLEALALEERPDAVVLIDYPGFNLRFAKKMHEYGIPVIWYISPQVWAWKKGRIPVIAEVVDKMMCIFPFEVDTYSKTDLDVEFIGHPLVHEIREQLDPEITRDDNTVLLLPGSRTNEVKKLLKPMLETAQRMHESNKELKFVISAPREKIVEQIKGIYNEFSSRISAEQQPNIEICCGKTRYWMQKATAGIAASGTVTVECAISGLPLVVTYKMNPITYSIARRVVKLDYFTMVNILGKKKIYEEFLQGDVNANTLSEALTKILPSGSRRSEIDQDIAEVIESISGGTEGAAKRAAKICADFIRT